MDKYRLLEEIAESGIGRVHLAIRDGEAEEEASTVVKVIHERFRRNSFFSATLFSEAPNTLRFRHPHALGVEAVGESEQRLYIAIERASGPTWAALRDRARAAGQTFTVDAIIVLGLQVAQLLSAASRHPWSEGESEGLVAGQLAPQSIYVAPSGEMRVVGMGLGRSRVCLPPTRGRLPYRAPELFAREPVRPSSDVYALGVLLYDAFSGNETFERSSVSAVKAAVLEEKPATLSHIPAPIDQLLRRMMAKRPEERPIDPEEIVRSLRSGLGREPSVLDAEWAEHVRVLFPERQRARPSVPYVQTRGRARANSMVPDGLPGTEIPAIGPDAYDIEDLALALETGDVGAGPLEVPPVEAPRPPPVPQDGKAAPSASLGGLDAVDESFDVDSIVNAIVSSRPRRPASKPKEDGPTTPRPAVTPRPRQVPEAPAPTGFPSPRQVASGPSDDLRAGSADLRTGAPMAAGLPAAGPAPAQTPTADLARVPDERGQLAVGDVIQDRYRVIEELGRGGMSIVYRAQHMHLLKDVAVKLLRPELSMLQNVVERFQREARAVCRLESPHIVRVTDFGRTEDDLLYLVMDLIEGGSLAGLLKRRERVEPKEAVDLVVQILSGLMHAHESDIVHRDLKPDNIMLLDEARPTVKILDFGIAKLGGSGDTSSITQAGTVFGTPRYMSPEQAAGEPVDHRTDLYTVGVILYQLLTGKVPFEGDSTVQLLAKVLTQAPPPMEFEAAHPVVREELTRIAFRALAKEAEDRFASAAAFKRALESVPL
ncbi:MAG: protein kinase [Myxococcota bacterium]